MHNHTRTTHTHARQTTTAHTHTHGHTYTRAHPHKHAPPRAHVHPTGEPPFKELRETFERSVVKRLMTDVPYGVLLSGGLDSSLVCAFSLLTLSDFLLSPTHCAVPLLLPLTRARARISPPPPPPSPLLASHVLSCRALAPPPDVEWFAFSTPPKCPPLNWIRDKTIGLTPV